MLIVLIDGLVKLLHAVLRVDEAITPMTYKEAMSWAETHLDADTYEEEFGAVDDDGEPAQVAVWVSAKAKAALNRKMSETGMTQAEIIEELLLSL